MKKLLVLMCGLVVFFGTSFGQSNYKTHTIKDGETLTQLANKYGTTVGDIMRLNQMTTDSKLIIGEQVKIPSKDNDTAAPTVNTPETHIVASGETLYKISKDYNVSIEDIKSYNNMPDNTIKVGQVLYLKEQTKVVPVVAVDTFPPAIEAVKTPIDQPDSNMNISSTQTIEKPRNPSVFDQVTTATRSTTEGLYALAYKEQGKGTELVTKGSAGIFKSASGWKDQKYFILMNDVNPGTLVKVKANGQTIYAKVLWNLGNVKENEGLSYRLSDAAANVLAVGGDKFDIEVSYYKQ